jgi:hypothetical protein
VLNIFDEEDLPAKYYQYQHVKDADLLGRAECLLSEVVGARNSTYDKELTGNVAGRKYGRIRVQSEELAEGNCAGYMLELILSGKDLAAKDGACDGLHSHPHIRPSQSKPCLFSPENSRLFGHIRH